MEILYLSTQSKFRSLNSKKKKKVSHKLILQYRSLGTLFVEGDLDILVLFRYIKLLFYTNITCGGIYDPSSFNKRSWIWVIEHKKYLVDRNGPYNVWAPGPNSNIGTLFGNQKKKSLILIPDMGWKPNFFVLVFYGNISRLLPTTKIRLQHKNILGLIVWNHPLGVLVFFDIRVSGPCQYFQLQKHTTKTYNWINVYIKETYCIAILFIWTSSNTFTTKWIRK